MHTTPATGYPELYPISLRKVTLSQPMLAGKGSCGDAQRSSRHEGAAA